MVLKTTGSVFHRQVFQLTRNWGFSVWEEKSGVLSVVVCARSKPVESFVRWPSLALHQSAGSKPQPCQHISCSSYWVSLWPMASLHQQMMYLTLVWSRRPTILALPLTIALPKKNAATSKKTWQSWKTSASKAWNMNLWWRIWEREFATRRRRVSAVPP